MTKEQEKKYLKTGAAASYLGISRSYLKKLAGSDIIPVSKVSARLHLYSVADLDAFVAGGKQ